MKYLKYFEGISHDSVKQTITEICYDLTDTNNFSVEFENSNITRSRRNEIIIRGNSFLLSDVEDTLLRIKDFLGIRRFCGCLAVKKDSLFSSKISLRHIDDVDKLSQVVILYEPIEFVTNG